MKAENKLENGVETTIVGIKYNDPRCRRHATNIIVFRNLGFRYLGSEVGLTVSLLGKVVGNR